MTVENHLIANSYSSKPFVATAICLSLGIALEVIGNTMFYKVSFLNPIRISLIAGGGLLTIGSGGLLVYGLKDKKRHEELETFLLTALPEKVEESDDSDKSEELARKRILYSTIKGIPIEIVRDFLKDKPQAIVNVFEIGHLPYIRELLKGEGLENANQAFFDHIVNKNWIPMLARNSYGLISGNEEEALSWGLLIGKSLARYNNRAEDCPLLLFLCELFRFPVLKQKTRFVVTFLEQLDNVVPLNFSPNGETKWLLSNDVSVINPTLMFLCIEDSSLVGWVLRKYRNLDSVTCQVEIKDPHWAHNDKKEAMTPLTYYKNIIKGTDGEIINLLTTFD